MSANCEEIKFFNSFRILVGTPLDPVDLFSFNFEITILDYYCSFNEKMNHQKGNEENLRWIYLRT